jgi:hypothetical protein
MQRLAFAGNQTSLIKNRAGRFPDCSNNLGLKDYERH